MTAAPAPAVRVRSVDALRGLVMIIMALDHVRDFLHADAMLFRPEDLSRTTAILFFTRWVTHLCAPVFMFTAGLGAFFWMQRRRSPAGLPRFLWTRGLWLVFLDLVVVRAAMLFSLTSGPVILNILWALGWSMIILSFLVQLPFKVVAGISVGAIALHNLMDPISAEQFGGAGWIWNLLHQPGLLKVPGPVIIVGYPLVPWFAVMAAGFCWGRVMQFEPARRRRWMMRTGLAMIAAFLILRSVNVYGDPVPWSAQIPGTAVLSFLNCTKYPPSLDFVLMTIGPALLLLAWFDRIPLTARNPIVIFGRVPLFYFVLHLFFIHALAIPLAWIRYGDARFVFNPQPNLGGSAAAYPTGYGYSLATIYMLWAAVVLVMFPLCAWFAGLKERHREWWWLAYL